MHSSVRWGWLIPLVLLSPVAWAQDEPEAAPPPNPAGSPADAGKKKDEGPPKREVDQEGPEAQALAEMLHVEPRYGKQDRRVELEYDFGEDVHLEDFESSGFDRVETRGELELAAGSQREAMLRHTLHMKGEFEVEFHCRVEWMAPSSQVVFFLGNGKSGGLWGPGWCKQTSRGFKPVSGKVARIANDARAKFGGARDVKVRLTVGSGEVACRLNGIDAGKTRKLSRKLEGRIGIFMKNVRMKVTRIIIKGEIDASKL